MSEETKPTNFIREIIDADLESGKHAAIVTRFPPEPNGYLHIGHAKSICLNFGIAADYNGTCNLRYDDTNPVKEDQEYVDSIANDVRWLGWNWGGDALFASDYFEQMYGFAVELIEKGLAYVCDLTPEQFKDYRGVPTRPGKESPHRNRSVEENLDLFQRMRAGEFEDGSLVLRAKIDMSSPNLHMRDPAIYRIRHATHHRTGDDWCLYPIYDFAHCLEDAIEGITHSICTLEFEDHRPLYDWIIDNVSVPSRPRQYEFSRLNITNMVMSKRKLLRLVEEGIVAGWDDPRMPTIAGLRRRGYSPESIRNFCEKVGVTKFKSLTDFALLEFCVREHLNKVAERRMAVLDPLKVIITNYPEGQSEEFEPINNPEDPDAGTHTVPFSREIYIERADFLEDAPRKFFRLSPGREVRLKYAYYITCDEVIKDDDGRVIELHCSYDPESRGGGTPDNRKVKGTLHWVSAQHAVEAEVRLYDRLFTVEQPDVTEDGQDFTEFLNPDSLLLTTGYLEPSLAELAAGTVVQFERTGYFAVDPDSTDRKPLFNRTVTLRDSWKKS